MNLQQHLALEGSRSQCTVDPDHRNFDQIGCRSLDRGVGSSSLTECANVEIPFSQLGDIPPPSKNRLHVSVLAREGHHRIKVVPNALKALEVAGDECLRFRVLYSQLA